MTKKMNPEIKALWIEGLTSGKFEQGQGRLAMNGKYCCLGVLCELAVISGVDLDRAEVAGRCGEEDCEGECSDNFVGISYDGSTALLPQSVMHWAGLEFDYGWSRLADGYGDSLPSQNDDGADFHEIAEVINERL